MKYFKIIKADSPLTHHRNRSSTKSNQRQSAERWAMRGSLWRMESMTE